MSWIIASVPFWLVGFLFFPIGIVAVYTQHRPEETNEELAGQALTMMAFGGALLLLAAWLCS